MAKKQIIIGDIDRDSPEEKKRKLSSKSIIIIGGVIVTIIIVSVAGMYKGNKEPSMLKMANPGVDLDPAVADKDLWRDRAQVEMKMVNDQLKEISKKLAQEAENRILAEEKLKSLQDEVKGQSDYNKVLKNELQSAIKNLDQKIAAAKKEVIEQAPKLNFIKDENESKGNKPKPLMPQIPKPNMKAPDFNKSGAPKGPFAQFKMPNPKSTPDRAPKPPKNPFATKKVSPKNETVVKTEAVVKEVGTEKDGMLISGIPQEEANKIEAEKVAAKKKIVKSPYAGFLPSGSFAPVAIISGLDAGAGEETQKNPQPVLLRIQDNATVPSMQGMIKYKLKGCFLSAVSYGDISSERVMIKPTRLSCVDASRKLILSAGIDGYISDFDNTLGLRGTVEYRDGARIAKSILASSASSLAQLAAMGSGVSTATLGSGINYDDTGNLNLPSVGELGSAAGFSAFGSSIEIIAKRYADQAKQIYPIIVLPGGRKGTVVFTKGANLKWDRYDKIYQEEIEPKNEGVVDNVRGGIIAR